MLFARMNTCISVGGAHGQRELGASSHKMDSTAADKTSAVSKRVGSTRKYSRDSKQITVRATPFRGSG